MAVPIKIIRWVNKHSIDIYYRLPAGIRGRLRGIYSTYRTNNPERFITTEIDGIKYNLDLNEEIDNSIYYQGCFEPMTVRIIKKYVKSGMTVIDIGANVGCHTVRFAKQVGASGKVIAFEPTKYAYEKLKKNVALNMLKNTVLEKSALSDKSVKKQMVQFKSSYPLDNKVKRAKDIISITTLDEYVSKHNVGKVDFIKLDVDGFEYKIIRGAMKTIKMNKPIIITEIGVSTLKNAGDDINDLIGTLSRIGYRFYSDKNQSEFYDKSKMIAAIPADGTINVLCIADRG